MLHWISTLGIVCFFALHPEAACLPDSLITSEKSRINAIDCLQRTGNHHKAAAHIGRLRPSLARDTLHLRQLLLSDSLPAAQLFADTATLLGRTLPVKFLWRIRIALFRGKTDACSALLDSLSSLPSRTLSAELVEYRYWLLRLADSPESLAKFAQIEYTLYKGDREAAAKHLCTAQPGGESYWRLAVHIARRQLDNSEAAAALATLRCAPAEKEPEYMYHLAESQAGSGSVVPARALLERLMLEFPGNLYAVKARLLLARLPK